MFTLMAVALGGGYEHQFDPTNASGVEWIPNLLRFMMALGGRCDRDARAVPDAEDFSRKNHDGGYSAVVALLAGHSLEACVRI